MDRVSYEAVRGALMLLLSFILIFIGLALVAISLSPREAGGILVVFPFFLFKFDRMDLAWILPLILVFSILPLLLFLVALRGIEAQKV